MKLRPIVFFLVLAQILDAQIQDKVDFVHAEVYIEPMPDQKSIEGTVKYQFQVLKNIDSIFLDAKNMDFSSVLLDGERARFTNNGKTITLKKKFKRGDSYSLELDFTAKPKQTVYFLGWEDEDPVNDQIWTQGQGKYTSHWLPSFDDMNEKVEFDLQFKFDTGYSVIANGKLVRTGSGLDNEQVWHFDMQKPMSSYLLAFAIGNFAKLEDISTSGVPLEMYYEPQDSAKVEPTYRYTREIFGFLETEIGIPYPWQNYKQIPVRDFLYAGMENTGATIFSNTFMVDSVAFVDKNYVNVNAHELAHQWFGNLVTEQSGAHHWLHEGFATYYAYLSEKQIFGVDYFYWRLYDTALSLANFSGEGNGEALTNANAGSLTFYEKGAWALVMLRERVGDTNFNEGIRNYLSKYAYQNVTITDFMWEMEKASGMNLSDFEEVWLQESEFPFERVKQFLSEKNNSIKTYFEIQDNIKQKPETTESILLSEWSRLKSEELKQHLLLDYGDKLSDPFITQLLNTEGLKVRQAIITSIKVPSDDLINTLEKLLDDESYVTKEITLYKLWLKSKNLSTGKPFPNDLTFRILDKLQNVEGLPGKNIRLLWLTLALITPNYQDGQKPQFYKELVGYTSPNHHFEIRQSAFSYLYSATAGFDDQTLKNLIHACNHHVWHFKKSCRKILKEFLKVEENKTRLMAIYSSLDREQQQYIDKTLGR